MEELLKAFKKAAGAAGRYPSKDNAKNMLTAFIAYQAAYAANEAAKFSN